MRSQLYVALDVGYVSQDEFEQTITQVEELARIIGGLRASVVKQRLNRLLKKSEKTSEAVIPAKAGIQHITDFNQYNILDPGFRRGDEEFFINLLRVRPPVLSPLFYE